MHTRGWFPVSLCMALVALVVMSPRASAASAPVTTKTLVSWVTLANLTQQGGSALTLGFGNRFDGIVFGEVAAGKWMAGSDFFNRTQTNQAASPLETASPSTLVQMAIVYEGTSVTLYRNALRYAAYTVAQQQTFTDGLYVVMGMRHLGSTGFFAGSIDDARIYDRELTPLQLAALQPNQPSTPEPLAWWTFADGIARDHIGTFADGELLYGATIQNGKLILDGVNDSMIAANPSQGYQSPVHYRPRLGVFADPIPFFWQGEYHVFYLRGGLGKVSWEHIRSTDLVHWEELPTALVSDGAPDSPDGMHMFTGSVIERNGTFHIFYTGHNPNNPAGLEFIMHATSSDLITWTKQSADVIAPDGVHYAATPHGRNWRDPFVFWCEEEQHYWMLVIATHPTNGQSVQGLLASPDLITWTQDAPIAGAVGQECPDLFKIGGTYYLLGGDHYASSTNLRGPYTRPASGYIDNPGVYAGKRQFDGQRHIWTGWAWDTGTLTDDNVLTWGGYQCLPRELYPGPNGELYCRPAAEVTAFFSHTVFDLNAAPADEKASPVLPWRLDVPVADYMLECTAQLDPAAVLQLYVREQPLTGEGYFLNINLAQQEISLGSRDLTGKPFTWTRSCAIDASQPVTIRMFVQGTLLECFVNDAYAFTRRIYNFPDGDLVIKSAGGAVTLNTLRIKTPDAATTAATTWATLD